MIEAVFHGHSFVEIKYESVSLLIDPFIAGNSSCDISLEDVISNKPSYIIVTHGHADHIGDSLEILQKTSATLISTYEIIERVKTQGVEASRCSAHQIGGSVDYDDMVVKFTPAFHGGQIAGTDLCGIAAGVLVNIQGHCIHHAGDTGLTKEFELLGEYENIAVSFLPIGDRFTMGIEDAVRAISMIKPKYAVPVHYNTWDIIQANTDTFAREVMQQGVAVPKILKPGQMIVLD